MKKRLLSTLLALCMVITLSTPVNAFDAAKPIQNIIAAGGNHAGMVDENGVLWMWGDNTYGQLGNGGRASTNTPVKIMDGVISVSASEYGQGNMPRAIATAAIKSDGSLWTWGVVDSNIVPGILGSSTGGNSFVEQETIAGFSQIPIQTEPVKILDNVASVSLGGWCALAIQKDGSLWTWGYVNYDESGLSSKVPVKVMDDVASACAGPMCIAAIKTDGSLWMWGDDLMAYESSWSLSQTPTKVLEGAAEVSIGYTGDSAAVAYVAAVKKDGSLWMWGTDWGRLGLPEQEDSVNGSPIKMMDGVAHVSAGCDFIAVVKTDGSLWTWGDNYAGELGNGTMENSVTPTKVMDDVAAVSAGGSFTLAVKNDGTVWSWGANYDGMLGNGGKGNVTTDYGTVCQTIPSQIPGLKAKTAQSAQPTQPTTPSAPSTPSGISVTVDGMAVTWTDAAPFIDANSRTMVPLRAVADAMGLNVNWDGSAREAVFTNGSKTIYFPIDSNTARTSDGGAVQMDTAAVIVNERTYAPIRYLAEYFGYEVGWNAATRTVTIK